MRSLGGGQARSFRCWSDGGGQCPLTARWPARSPPAGLPELGDLVRRLDDTGCAYGRVSAARLEHLTRAYERLDMKLNAVLMAATGTFLSTLAGLLLYYVRGGSH